LRIFVSSNSRSVGGNALQSAADHFIRPIGIVRRAVTPAAPDRS
jgi:hypothetical protein